VSISPFLRKKDRWSRPEEFSGIKILRALRIFMDDDDPTLGYGSFRNCGINASPVQIIPGRPLGK